MAQPGLIVANRTGTTSFWNYNWFLDKNNQQNYQTSNLINEFVYFFLIFGVTLNFNPWVSQKFYNLTQKFKWFYIIFKYYRLLSLKKIYFPLKSKYLRKSVPIIYPSRIWVLKVFKWLLIFWFFYKPKMLKKNKIKLLDLKKFNLQKEYKPYNYLIIKRLLFLSKLRDKSYIIF